MYTHVPPLLYDMYSRGQKINVAGNQESKQSLCGGKEPQKSMDTYVPLLRDTSPFLTSLLLPANRQ